MRAEEVAVPELLLALPGNWVSFSLGSDQGADEFVALVRGELGESAAEEVHTHLNGFAVAGGVQVLVRVDEGAQTLVLVSWPREGADSRATGSEALQRRVDAEKGSVQQAIVSSTGSAVLRQIELKEDSAIATYWISHPVSGRLLCLQVEALGNTEDLDGEPWHAPYDLLAEYLTWDEPEAGS